MGPARRRGSSSSEGGKRNRHVVDLLFAGDRPTVAAGYGQHHPTSEGSAPKFARMFETATSFFTGVRMKSHWSALSQSSRSQRPSGDQTTLVNAPAPLKIGPVGPASTPVSCSELRLPSVSMNADRFPSGATQPVHTRAAPLSTRRMLGPRCENTSTAWLSTATSLSPSLVQLSCQGALPVCTVALRLRLSTLAIWMSPAQ